MKNPDLLILLTKSIGIAVSVMFLFVIGYQIAAYTNDAPDVSALSQEQISPNSETPTPVELPNTEE